jgi:hypothetical protein
MSNQAVIFGKRDDLLAKAKDRIAEAPDKYFENRVYGEHEAGGTQVLYLSSVAFDKIGLPKLGTTSLGHYATKVTSVIYKWLSGPVLMAGVWALPSGATGIVTSWSGWSTRRRRGFPTSYELPSHLAADTERHHSHQSLAVRRPCQSGTSADAIRPLPHGLAALGLSPRRHPFLLAAWSILWHERCLRLGRLEDLQRHDADRAWLRPTGVGMAAWVFNRQKLHVVMRTALVSGFLFYATGLLALGFDVGRPWNFYSAVLPWRWNSESAMLEISICMPLYCAVFLSFEILPLFLERIYYTGNDRARDILRLIAPAIRKAYPFVIVGAYVIPLMHQSSLGGLLLLAGTKIHPLWQSPVMPLALSHRRRLVRIRLYHLPAAHRVPSLFAHISTLAC